MYNEAKAYTPPRQLRRYGVLSKKRFKKKNKNMTIWQNENALEMSPSTRNNDSEGTRPLKAKNPLTSECQGRRNGRARRALNGVTPRQPGDHIRHEKISAETVQKSTV